MAAKGDTGKKRKKGKATSETKPPEDTASDTDRRRNLRGIWEVSYESGAVIGYFDGTPNRIAAYLLATRPEGKAIKMLNFLRLKVRKVPNELYRDRCCDKKFTKLDRYCSRCGKSLKVDMKLRKGFKFSIAVAK